MTLSTPMRFAGEALILVALGIALAAADLELLPFVLVMAAAWILVAWGERVLVRPAVARPTERRQTPRPTQESISVDRPPEGDAVATRPQPAPEPVSPAEEEPEPERSLEAVPDPDPEAEPEPEPEPVSEEREPESVVELPQVARRRPDGWNLWDLEHRAQERAGEDPIRDEEWNALLVSLRDFAQPDGRLPPEFDELVNESFGELISRRT